MPKSKPLQLIIDTNLWISFIISNKQQLLDPLLFSGKARLLFSTELITEIESTITKPKLKNINAFVGVEPSKQLHSIPTTP